MNNSKHYRFHTLACLILVGQTWLHTPAWADDEWMSDWAIREGFKIEVAADGFELPTAVAVVPNPGSAPSDPVVFVTELMGAIKTINNDGSVSVFADDFFVLEHEAQLPDFAGEVGMAGIALAPEYGYVFASFAYQDQNGTLRNNIVRFETTPGTFNAQPTNSIRFDNVFAQHPSSVSHQIGPMVIQNDTMFVGVGDAETIEMAQNPDSTNGKILRMTLDGQPLDDNPLYLEDAANSARNYVWAMGVRNPFSLSMAYDRLFAADNGPIVDRFMEVNEGYNYGWDGSDWSMSIDAEFVFLPSVGPVQMDFIGSQHSAFPASYRQRFYVAFGGLPSQPPGPGERQDRSIVMIDFDFEKNFVPQTPSQFLRYQGSLRQMPVGVAFSDEAMYMAALFPYSEGRGGAVFKISYDPQNQHPVVLGRNQSAPELIEKFGCASCHGVDAEGSRAGSLEFSQLVPRVMAHIQSADFQQAIAEDTGEENADNALGQLRQLTPDINGARDYIRLKLLYPRVDNPSSQMPDFGFSEDTAAQLARHLTIEPEGDTLVMQIRGLVNLFIPAVVRQRHVIIGFGVGGVLGAGGVIFLILVWLGWRRFRTRNA